MVVFLKAACSGSQAGSVLATSGLHLSKSWMSIWLSMSALSATELDAYSCRLSELTWLTRMAPPREQLYRGQGSSSTELSCGGAVL